MRLELILRDDKKNDKLHRGVVESIEFDSLGRESESRDDFDDGLGGGMRNGDAEAYSGAHRFLALFQGSENALAVSRIDFALTHQQFDQLDDRGPALGRLHLRNDLLGS